MTQIRAAWIPGTHSSREAGVSPSGGGDWVADTPEARQDLTTLIASGNEICGAGTHWLEERPTVPAMPGCDRAAAWAAPAETAVSRPDRENPGQ